jgi:dTMP kinase
MRGRLITIEGGEGAGKTTQAAALQRFLAAHGVPLVLTREPGGTPFAEAVRRILLDPPSADPTPLAETLLFLAARADHVARLIEPALAAGTWVVSDRFSDSTRAYQGAGGGVPAETIAALERLVLGALAPDLTLVLDLPAEAGLARVRARASYTPGTGTADPIESRAFAYHQRLREGFLAIAAAEPWRCVVVDASRPPAEVQATIESVVRNRLGVG